MSMHAKKVINAAGSTQESQSKPRVEPMLHGPVLTPEDYTLLVSLPEQLAGARVRSDMGLLLADEDTRESLIRYTDFFAFGGVDVTPTVAAIPKMISLRRLQQHLDLAQELVRRHINAEGEPIAAIASDVRRLVMGTPEGSAMRAAFATFDARWRDTFRGGRTPSADETTEDTSKPASPK